MPVTFRSSVKGGITSDVALSLAMNFGAATDRGRIAIAGVGLWDPDVTAPNIQSLTIGAGAIPMTLATAIGVRSHFIYYATGITGAQSIDLTLTTTGTCALTVMAAVNADNARGISWVTASSATGSASAGNQTATASIAAVATQDMIWDFISIDQLATAAVETPFNDYTTLTQAQDLAWDPLTNFSAVMSRTINDGDGVTAGYFLTQNREWRMTQVYIPHLRMGAHPAYYYGSP